MVWIDGVEWFWGLTRDFPAEIGKIKKTGGTKAIKSAVSVVLPFQPSLDARSTAETGECRSFDWRFAKFANGSAQVDGVGEERKAMAEASLNKRTTRRQLQIQMRGSLHCVAMRPRDFGRDDDSLF